MDSLQLAWRLPERKHPSQQLVQRMERPVNRTSPPVQAVEFTPEKKIVWVLRSWVNPDLGPATTIQILDDANALENVTFGDIK